MLLTAQDQSDQAATREDHNDCLWETSFLVSLSVFILAVEVFVVVEMRH